MQKRILRSELDEREFFDEMSMTDPHDILSDAERQALGEMNTTSAPASSVLVVDDNLVNREALSAYLRSHGIHTYVAQGAQQAFEQLKAHPRIGLMITDLRMAPDDGFALIQRVRESEEAELAHVTQLPIILVSGDIDVPAAVHAMHLGVLDVLVKPVKLEQLLELVSTELKLEQGRRR